MSNKTQANKKSNPKSKLLVGDKEVKLVHGIEYDEEHIPMFNLEYSITKDSYKELKKIIPEIRANRPLPANIVLKIKKEAKICSYCLGMGTLAGVPCDVCNATGEILV